MLNKEAYLYLLHQELRKKGAINFEALKMNTHIDEDEDMMKLLLSYLDEQLDNFSFNSSSNQNKSLKKCLSYIKYNPHRLEVSPETYLKIARHLRDTLEMIDYKLANPGELYCIETVNNNYKILQAFKDSVMSYINHLNQEGYNIYDSSSTYTFMRDNIVNCIDYDYIRRIIKNYPSIVNLGKKDKPYLVEIVANNFIDSIAKDSKYDKILYYQKVLLLFLKSPIISCDMMKTEAILSKGLDLINNSKKATKEKQGEVLLLNEINNNMHIVKKNIAIEEKKRHNLRIKYQLNIDYSVQEKEEAEKINIQNDAFIDERDKYVITIDSPDTNRFEDAISYKLNDDGTIDVTIYTPDIADFVSADSLLAKRAETSALNYFVPDDIIHKYFSLDEGGDRFAIAYQMQFDKDYNIKNININKSRINVKKNLYYCDIKSSMKEKDNYLLNLYTIALNLGRKFENEEIIDVQEAFDEMKKSGNFNVGSSVVINICKQLNCILSNTYTLPFICHGHSGDGEKMLSTLTEYFNDEERQKVMASIIKNANSRKVFSPLKLDSKNNYADFCSPLRKPDSLWNQRIIIDRNDSEKIFKYTSLVDEHVNEINEKNCRINYYEKELIDGKKKILK